MEQTVRGQNLRPDIIEEPYSAIKQARTYLRFVDVITTEYMDELSMLDRAEILKTISKIAKRCKDGTNKHGEDRFPD